MDTKNINMDSGLNSGLKPSKWRAPNTPNGLGGKSRVIAGLDPYDYQLLLTFCEETGLSNSHAVALMVHKVLDLIYDGSGKRIKNIEDLNVDPKGREDLIYEEMRKIRSSLQEVTDRLPEIDELYKKLPTSQE